MPFEELQNQDPAAGSADPYALCSNSDFSRNEEPGPHCGIRGSLQFVNKAYVFEKSGIQDPTLGSAGSDCFARESHSFVYFWTPPRALIIILNKARGASRACLSGPLPELALVL